MEKLMLNERFEAPMQIEDFENEIFKMQETIISQVVKMEDEALVKAIRNYAQQKATTEKENVRIMLLDESIADKIIRLGIEEYIKNNEVEVIEENKEIEEFKTEYTMREMDIQFKNKINELVRQVNKLTKEMEAK